MRRVALSLLLLSSALLFADQRQARAESETASVTVVHAVPGLTVDVYVNGALTLPSFVPTTITDPLALPPGTYDIAIVPEGGDPTMPAIAGSATVAAGDNASIVAHLDAAGAPSLSVFADDLSLADPGEGRIIVRHVAAAPAVDVRLFRRFFRWRRAAGAIQDLVNGSQSAADVRSGRYDAFIAPAGAADPVFGPAKLRPRAGVATFVYAYGSLADGTFDLLVNTRDLRAETAKITVVHGVLGLTVDVYLNGELALAGFEPRTITDEIELPCGDYDIAIVPAGGSLASPAIEGSATLAANSNTAIVAHLNASGGPTLSLFENNLATTRRARLVVRHAAAAPAVDARLSRRIFWWSWPAGVIRGAVNGAQAEVEVYDGRYAARITPAGNPHVTVLGPAHLRLRRATTTFVYAIGSLEAGTLELLVQVLPTR